MLTALVIVFEKLKKEKEKKNVWYCLFLSHKSIQIKGFHDILQHLGPIVGGHVLQQVFQRVGRVLQYVVDPILGVFLHHVHQIVEPLIDLFVPYGWIDGRHVTRIQISQSPRVVVFVKELTKRLDVGFHQGVRRWSLAGVHKVIPTGLHRGLSSIIGQHHPQCLDLPQWDHRGWLEGFTKVLQVGLHRGLSSIIGQHHPQCLDPPPPMGPQRVARGIHKSPSSRSPPRVDVSFPLAVAPFFGGTLLFFWPTEPLDVCSTLLFVSPTAPLDVPYNIVGDTPARVHFSSTG